MNLKNKTILITGGTGSLGQALVDKLISLECKVIIYSRDEGKHALLFQGRQNIISVIGDVRDYNKLSTTLSIHKPEYIIHAAALKRIDDMEFHPDECIKTNINGAMNVIDASIDQKVKKIVRYYFKQSCNSFLSLILDQNH
jgi:UDP-N-acetylglucosamine 4,6-dehydratase